VTVPRTGGGRTRKTFKERAEAEAYFKFMQNQLADFGSSVTAISDQLRVEATQAQRLLEPHGVSVLQAAEYYVASRERRRRRGRRGSIGAVGNGKGD
jgi:hypothetical protein